MVFFVGIRWYITYGIQYNDIFGWALVDGGVRLHYIMSNKGVEPSEVDVGGQAICTAEQSTTNSMIWRGEGRQLQCPRAESDTRPSGEVGTSTWTKHAIHHVDLTGQDRGLVDSVTDKRTGVWCITSRREICMQQTANTKQAFLCKRATSQLLTGLGLNP